MMRVAATVALTLAIALGAGAASAAPEVSGEFKTIGGIRVLHLWGSYYEMGFAHGYLIAGDIVELFDEVFVPLVGGAAALERNREKYRDRYVMPEWYAEETRGILDGIAASGAGLYIESLDRDLDADDFGTMDALSDIRTVYACASFAAWNEATASDPDLRGEPALARNLDWWTPMGRPYLLARNTVVIGREPDGARATLMVGFSGLSGCYSCMNDAGVATTRMMTNHHTPGWQMDFSRPFTPLNIVMRDALEKEDVDGDGESTVDDLAAALAASVRSSAYNIMIVGPMSAGREPVVAEINHKQFTLRRAADDPELPPAMLAATNSMRKLYPPVPDSRYSAMKRDVLSWNGALTLPRFWEVLQAMYDEWLTGATTQSMVFVPVTRSLAVQHTDADGLAPFKPPVWIEWADVFGAEEPNDNWHQDDTASDDDDDDNDSADDIADENSSDDPGNGCGC